jgi:hypothetical protein
VEKYPNYRRLFEAGAPGTALEAVVFKDGPIYLVRVDQSEACTTHPYVLDWFEVYAVRADGKILARRLEEDPPR